MSSPLTTLNDHLFKQLERLSQDGLSGKQLEQEVRRADAITDLAEQVIRNADVQLRAAALLASHGDRLRQHLPMLEGPKS